MTTIVIPTAQTLPVALVEQIDPEIKLSTWVMRYWEEEVAGNPKSTMSAKRADLQLFLTYFGQIRSDAIEN